MNERLCAQCGQPLSRTDLTIGDASGYQHVSCPVPRLQSVDSPAVAVHPIEGIPELLGLDDAKPRYPR
jgi:hypothetical protein